ARRDLSLWEKRKDKIMTLSGGMKRRVLIAKAMGHEPATLFLDEPTAGVDVELRRDMWALVRGLRESGVTIILTTHYIDEAEEMADRIGVINKGELIVVEEKIELMKKLGKKQLTLNLLEPLASIPLELSDWGLALKGGGCELEYTFVGHEERTGIPTLRKRMTAVDGVAYGAFIVPGLIMLSLFTQSISNASFGIYFPKFTGTIYELLSAPVSYLEIVIAYVGAAATKSIVLGLIILVTASLFVPIKILHPLWMITFLVLTATTFSLF